MESNENRVNTDIGVAVVSEPNNHYEHPIRYILVGQQDGID